MTRLYDQIVQNLEENNIPIDHHGLLIALMNVLEAKFDALEKHLDALRCDYAKTQEHPQ